MVATGECTYESLVIIYETRPALTSAGYCVDAFTEVLSIQQDARDNELRMLEARCKPQLEASKATKAPQCPSSLCFSDSSQGSNTCPLWSVGISLYLAESQRFDMFIRSPA